MKASPFQTSRATIAKHVARAIERHRDRATFVKLVAAELPPNEQRGWLELADALATGDMARGTTAAEAALAPWIPLFASPAGDPRLLARILETAGKPPQAPEAGWRLFAYPLALAALSLGLLGLLSATVLTVFETIFEDFGMELPLVTRAALAIRPFMASVWEPLLLATGLVIVARWLLARWSARGSAITAAFTRSLARLVAADVPTDEAITLAEQVVHAPAVDLASPGRPLTYAAAAALDFVPRSAAILLDAVAACHEDRGRGAISLGQWFVGPALIVTVGLLVGFVALALFWPLLNLVSALS
jgi:hypothetical protein